MSVDNEDDKVCLQDFNQALSVAGARAIMPDDWAAASPMAEAMDDATHGELVDPLEQNACLKSVAAEKVRIFFDPAFRRSVNCSTAIEYDTRWCPEFDESKPETMNRYYAIVGGYENLVPLTCLDQWRAVGEQLATNTCTANLLAECYRQRERNQVATLYLTAVVRGEYVVVFNLCQLCYNSIPYLKEGDWPEVSVPTMWHDDGKRGNQSDDDDDDEDDPWAL